MHYFQNKAKCILEQVEDDLEEFMYITLDSLAKEQKMHRW